MYTDKLRILRANVVLNLTFYRRRSCSRSGRRNMYRTGRLALAARACWLCVSGVTRNSGAPGQISKSRLSSPPSPYLPSLLFGPLWGRGTPFPPCPFTFSFFPLYFSLSFIGFTYFLLLSIPSLSTRIVPLRFQAGGRRRRPNLGYSLCFVV